MKQKTIKLIVIQLIILIAFPTIFWKLYNLRYTNTVHDFEYLTALVPEEIIHYQERYKARWKYFVAAASLCRFEESKPGGRPEKLKEDEAEKAEYYSELILSRLKNETAETIDLKDIEKKYAEKFYTYLEILNTYNYYDNGMYIFPISIPSYYEDTFGADREGGKRIHQGTDLFNLKGTKIVSACDGVIERLGWNRLGGERVGIRGQDKNYYYYAHLDQINDDLYVGKEVSAGEYLGTMGNTGDAVTTPDHLHFGIELPNRQWINPYPFLKVWDYYTL